MSEVTESSKAFDYIESSRPLDAIVSTSAFDGIYPLDVSS
jgi:hypothetical protein